MTNFGIVFWGPWFVGILVFVVWVWQPIKEYKQMWNEKRVRYQQSQHKDTH